MPDYTLDASRCALIVQDLQNDVIIDGGAFAESGSPEHAKEQNVVEHVKDLAAFCRGKGIPVIHVWYIVEDGAPGLKLNAPLFNGVKDTGALVRGSWGAAPADGLEAQDGDFVVEKMRMSAWQGTRLENLLEGLGRDTIIITGAWTNMSIEHTSRTGADKGYAMVVPGGRVLDDERRLAQRVDQLRPPERVDGDHLRRRQGGARRLGAASHFAHRDVSRGLTPSTSRSASPAIGYGAISTGRRTRLRNTFSSAVLSPTASAPVSTAASPRLEISTRGANGIQPSRKRRTGESSRSPFEPSPPPSTTSDTSATDAIGTRCSAMRRAVSSTTARPSGSFARAAEKIARASNGGPSSVSKERSSARRAA